MSEGYFLLKSQRDSINEVLKKYDLTEEDFERPSSGASHFYHWRKEPRMHFIFQQVANKFDKFINTYTLFTPEFTVRNYKRPDKTIEAVDFTKALTRFEDWIKGQLIKYINETSTFFEDRKKNKGKEEVLLDKGEQPLSDNFYDPIPLENLNRKKKEVNETDIVYKDIHGQYTLEQLKKEYASQVSTNIKQGGLLTDANHKLDNERVKTQQLQALIDANKKSISYWFIISLVIVFVTYIIFTAHFLLDVQFNFVIAGVSEVIFVGLLSIFFFKEKAERRNIIGTIISGIVITAIIFLAGFFAKSYGLLKLLE
jgi:hypothetical protein